MDRTHEYLERKVDERMSRLIALAIPEGALVLDLGCGSGLYGPVLRSAGRRVVGLDYDPELCESAWATGAYDRVICGDICLVGALAGPVGAIFCSEVLEHVANADLPGVLKAMETTGADRIVITVPNPLSPHFRKDPTHILRYDIYSFLRALRASAQFRYTLIPLGFSEENRTRRAVRAVDPIARRYPICSPTVGYVGYHYPEPA